MTDGSTTGGHVRGGTSLSNTKGVAECGQTLATPWHFAETFDSVYRVARAKGLPLEL